MMVIRRSIPTPRAVRHPVAIDLNAEAATADGRRDLLFTGENG
jgi:hypothetical protein